MECPVSLQSQPDPVDKIVTPNEELILTPVLGRQAGVFPVFSTEMVTFAMSLRPNTTVSEPAGLEMGGEKWGRFFSGCKFSTKLSPSLTSDLTDEGCCFLKAFQPWTAASCIKKTEKLQGNEVSFGRLYNQRRLVLQPSVGSETLLKFCCKEEELHKQTQIQLFKSSFFQNLSSAL